MIHPYQSVAPELMIHVKEEKIKHVLVSLDLTSAVIEVDADLSDF